MPDRWRLGTRNPFTVYRVADGAHDVDHAREHFVTAFRREEDARRAVDAVNAQAADTQRAAPTRDVLVECGRSGEDTCIASHEHIDHRVGHPASAERACDPELHERVVLAFRWAYAVTVRTVGGACRTDIEWRQPSRTEAERMADVALAALRGAGADGGGEDEVDYASSAQRLRQAANALASRAGEWHGSAAVADGINKLVYEARRVSSEPWVPKADGYELCADPHPHTEGRACVKAAGHNSHRDGRGDHWEQVRAGDDDAAAIARLASAAGVDPDAADPVGEIE